MTGMMKLITMGSTGSAVVAIQMSENSSEISPENSPEKQGMLFQHNHLIEKGIPITNPVFHKQY